MEIEKFKNETADQYLKIIELLKLNLAFLDHLPNELGSLLKELEHKTDDFIYAKKVMESYKSILQEAHENTVKVHDLLEKTKQMQIKINPQNFSE